jgi:predicted adenylyl cyclase CyaB
LDKVEGLGEFVELEVVLQSGQTTSDGIAVVHDLMTKLGITEDDLVTRAYIDLIEEASPSSG